MDKNNRKETGKRKKFYRAVSLAAAAAFFLCVCWLAFEFLVQPRLEDRSQDELREAYRSGISSAPSGAPGKPDRLGALKKISPDLAGWITVPRTGIDLPVVQAAASAPEFYLTHDYRGQASSYGCVFAGCRAPVGDSDSRSVILYGHSLLSGRMFTRLKDYKSLDFYKTSPLIFFDTGKGPEKWIILSVFVTNTLPEQGKPFDYTKSRFAGDGDYLNFVYQLRIRSLYNTGVSFNARDRILLLSTCSYEFKDFRQVVVARRVRAGENVSGAADRAAGNPKVLYPDCWYEKYGGKKPDWPATYEQAKKENLLSWRE